MKSGLPDLKKEQREIFETQNVFQSLSLLRIFAGDVRKLADENFQYRKSILIICRKSVARVSVHYRAVAAQGEA